MYDKGINDIIIDVKTHNLDKDWKYIAEQVNNLYGTNYTPNAVRKRYNRNKDKNFSKDRNQSFQNTEIWNADGSFESEQIVEDGARSLITKIRNCQGNKDKILILLGFDNEDWTLDKIQISNWEQNNKKEGKVQLYSLKYKVSPINSEELSLSRKVEIAKDVMTKEIKPLPYKKQKKSKMLVKDKMMELTGIELHLGKLAYKEDTTQDYNYEIASDRFRHIIKEIVKYQEQEKCDTCFLCIGNDFFNYDTITGTTTKGTQQTNDLTYRRMFKLGLELYTQAIVTLSGIFNKVDVRLQNGNHDKLTCFHLYLALDCAFRDYKNVSFSNNYKDVQCYTWGENAIFFTHGSERNKKLASTIPTEFGEIWGTSKYRELHVAHFHHEELTREDNGIIVRTVSSPSGIDQWHYDNRYIGAQQKYQIFIWDKSLGLTDIKHINFGG